MMKYYHISQEDAVRLGLNGYRKGGANGYIVTEGDIACSPDIKERADVMGVTDARKFINNL